MKDKISGLAIDMCFNVQGGIDSSEFIKRCVARGVAFPAASPLYVTQRDCDAVV
jgi:hypothetical protein